MYVQVHTHQWGPEDVRSLGAGIAGICELPDMGVRIQTLVLLIEHGAPNYLFSLMYITLMKR